MDLNSIASRSLPEPTVDRNVALTDLDTFGYCIIRDALAPKQLALLRDRVVAQAAGEVVAGLDWRDSGTNQRVWMLVNKGQAFRDLVLHPLVNDMMGHLLGKDFLLSSATANIAAPGSDPMYLHTDQGYVPFATAKPLVANIAWMLDDFTEENGGTRLGPGSHVREDWAVDQATPTLAAAGPAGSALVFDGRLIHGTGANQTIGTLRHAILTYYCRPFIRQQENFFLGLDPELETPDNAPLLKRLGYTIQHGLGRLEKPTQTGVLSRAIAPVGPLDAQGRPLAG
jgi:ectoine hydroxylase-related dioxygenase (phytanoyl-CoA dioxygenase family)